MARFHLFEIEDQKWCPSLIRETITDILVGLYNLLHIYEPAYQKINELIEKMNLDAIVDCCSGSGGPIRQLREYLDQANKKSVTITLTDKFPNTQVFHALERDYSGRIIGYHESVDACNLPSSIKGLRTFFSAFHHFKSEEALKILQNAVNNDAPIAIFESTQRSPVDFIRALISPLLSLVFLPFAKRLNWKKFVMTYLLPIGPFAFMWDYFVSNLRTYSISEMRSLINQLNAPDYQWETGKLWSKKGRSYIPYLIGYKCK